MTMNPIFKRVFNLLPEQYRAAAVIAGGAAVDVEKASDIDVFVLGIYGKDKISAFWDDMEAAHIPGITFREESKKKTKISPPDPQAVKQRHIRKLDSGDNTHNTVVCDIDTRGLLPSIQIIESPFTTPEKLLEDFDISVHCVAYGPDGTRYVLPGTTDTKTPPKIIRVADPELTLLRYRRLCLRYDIPPDTDELIKLFVTAQPPVRTENDKDGDDLPF